jgi:digeranylgeranylglycerophospholipid reductase
VTHRDAADLVTANGEPIRVDAVVVGAGPAGLMAARALRARGMDFVVLDKKKTLGLPLACGEGILLHELESLGLDFDLRSYGTLSRRQVFLFAGIEKRFSIDTFELDRPRFERRLAEPVLAQVLLDTGVQDVRESPDAVLLETHRGTFSARVAILAKGPDNRWPIRLGMTSRKHEMVVAYGGRFEGCRIPDLTWTIDLIEGLGTLGYFWIFPSSPTAANVGLGYLNRPSLGINLREEFAKAVRRHPPLEGAKMTLEVGGSIPISGALDRTFTRRILACGDFAGQVGALGDGIYYAMAAGKHAGEVAADALEIGRVDETTLAPYEARWKATFARSLQAGLFFRRILDRALRAGMARSLVRMMPAPLGPAILFGGHLRRTLGWVDAALTRFDRATPGD